MTIFQSIMMGLIQGLTEFLPVSSSGHLSLFKILFHVNTDTGLLFDVMLHIGTLVAVCIIYYKDIIKLIKEFVLIIIDLIINLIIFIYRKRGADLEYRTIIYNSYRRFLMMIIISTIPTAIMGYMGSDFVESAGELLFIPGICLIITAALLFVSDLIPNGFKKAKDASYGNALMIGVCQGLATLPGISRSGTTITACVLCGFDRKFAVKYSFILSIPAILGAMVFELKDLGGQVVAGGEMTGYVIGTIVAAVVGYVCIKLMLGFVKDRKFKYFSIYCLAVGILSLIGYTVMK